MASKPEMSFAKTKVDYVPVAKAKDELREFTNARAQGEKNMEETRLPFCGACMYQEFQKRKALWEFEKQQGRAPASIEVPSWQEFSGADKFNLVSRNERKNRREMSIDAELNYECKANQKHHVTICSSTPWHAETLETVKK